MPAKDAHRSLTSTTPHDGSTATENPATGTPCPTPTLRVHGRINEELAKEFERMRAIIERQGEELKEKDEELKEKDGELKEKDEENEKLRSRVALFRLASLPKPFSTPSELTRSAVGERTDHGIPTCTGHPWALDALRAFYQTPSDEIIGSAQKLLEERQYLHRMNNVTGLFSQRGCNGHEMTYTSVLSQCIQKLFGNKTRNWYHQLPLKEGVVDLALYVDDLSGGRLASRIPCAVVEFGWKKNDKSAQTSGYVLNIAHQIPDLLATDGHALLSVVWQIDRNTAEDIICIRVHGFPPWCARDSLFSTMFVWKGVLSGDSCARLFEVVKQFSDLCERSKPAKPRFWERHGHNVSILERKYVYKIYDYRPSRGSFVNYRRNYKNWNKLPDAKRLLSEEGPNNDDLVLIQYKYIEGNHFASNVEHFRSAVRELKSLHDEKLCHGDVRLGNMVFVENGNCVFIDFDFSGTPGSARYPPGYNIDLQDTERHPDAVQGATLENHHDWFSLAAVMGLHTPVEVSQREVWNELVDLVKLRELESFLVKSEESKFIALKLLNELNANLATGSPDRGNLDVRSGKSRKRKRPAENHVGSTNKRQSS